MSVSSSRGVLTEEGPVGMGASSKGIKDSKKNRNIVVGFIGFLVTVVVVVILTCVFTGTDDSDSNSSGNGGDNAVNLRLPTSIKPTHYTVKMQPLINGNFSILGSVNIEFDVTAPTSEVVLHIFDIVTKNESVYVRSTDSSNSQPIEITEQTYDLQTNFYTAKLANDLEAGKNYEIYMEYEGYLSDGLLGFYRSSYVDKDNITRWLASCSFEPTAARKAYPCFDEPALKATFDIKIARQKNMTALSNMPLNRTEPLKEEGWLLDHFDTSVIMSPYLTAFFVGDFEFVNSTYNDHVLFRVWAREEALDQTDYAIQAGPKILTYYEQYFGIEFPLPKQDMLALPDFLAGALENWGIISYRESAILYDEENSSAANKERIASVIAHEVAHQWFGDLVTMEWWTDLWLNEGFATYMEFVGASWLEPTWELQDTFVPNELQMVFGVDSLESSHPISIPVQDPNEIFQLFDAITYSKGSSLIRMMDHFLTDETFTKGLSNYLNEHKFANAQQDDLWEAMTQQGHEDGTFPKDLTVKTIMDSWTLQTGYPVINVMRHDDGTATLTQERFFLLQPTTTPNESLWWVPLTWTTAEDPNFNETFPIDWMTGSQKSKLIEGLPDNNTWVILNIQETGFYRVNYETSNWELLIDQLAMDHEVIHQYNRAQILDDSLDLARSGQLSYEIALAANAYMTNEIEYAPWLAALDNLNYIENMFTRTSGYGSLKKYLLTLLTPYYNSVGFEDSLKDPHLSQIKRALGISWACHLGLDDCVDNSVESFATWMKNPENNTIITPNQKSTVYCTAIGKGGEDEWRFAWDRYLESNLAAEKDTILRSLGCSNDIWILQNYLEMAFTDGSGIRKQDAGTAYSSVASNDIGRDLAWDYLRENIEDITNYYSSLSGVGDLISTVTSEFNTETQLKELMDFNEKNADILSSSSSYVDQSIERTRNNISWMNSYYQVIVDWLNDNGYSL